MIGDLDELAAFAGGADGAGRRVTGKRFGPYRLISPLGSGGMGEVWRAVDVRKERTVALKVLRPRLADDEDFARRFRREAALVAKLTGPNIVPIHDYGEIDGRLFIDMPLLDGSDLGALLERGGPMPAERAVEITAQVAKALDVAHRAGLVHRDVKPSNVLVCDSGGDDHVYLIDFGVSRALDGTVTSVTGSVMGTPAYMAPERFAGEGDHRSDIYALGCVLYEALTGHQPFTATNPLMMMNAHQNAPAPRPSARGVSIPPRLDDVIARALAKNPEERYSSASDLATAARQALVVPSAARVSSPPRIAQPVARPVVRPVVQLASPPRIDRQRAAASSSPHGPRINRSEPNGPPAPITPPADHTGARNRRTLVAVLTTIVVIGLLVASVVILILSPALFTSSGSETVSDNPTSTTPIEDTTPIEELTIDSSDTDGNGVNAVATTELDGQPVIISGGDATVRVWDLATGDPIGEPLTGHTDSVLGVATAELDGQPVIVSGSFDTTVRVWDLATGDPIGEPFTGHTRPVYAVATAELDGRPVVVSGGFDNTVRVSDLATGAPIGQPFTGHTDGVLTLATAELDGRPVIVSGSIDTTVRVWDLASGSPIGEPFTGHTSEIDAVATTELDGRPVIASGSADTTGRIWDLATGTPIGQQLTGHTSNVQGFATAVLGDRQFLISAGLDRTVRLWDLATGSPVGEPLTVEPLGAQAIITTQLEGRTVLVAGCLDNTIRTWDLDARAGS